MKLTHTTLQYITIGLLITLVLLLTANLLRCSYAGKGGYGMMDDKNMMDMRDMDMSDPMSMSMADMGKMLEGKTGDALDTAFLEGMIPHHQGAIDMAKYLEKSERPELQQLGQDIIAAQTKEIEQMQNWLKEWNLSETGTTQTSTNSMMDMENMMMGGDEDAMKEHCEMMPDMAGCEVYK